MANAIKFRDTTHDATRKRRMRKAQAVLIDSFPKFVYGTDNALYYRYAQTYERIGAHISDCGWGVRTSHRY